MTAALDHEVRETGSRTAVEDAPSRWTAAALVPAVVAVAGVAIASAEGLSAGEAVRAVLVVAWSLAAAALMSSPSLGRLGRVLLLGSMVAAVGVLSAGVTSAAWSGAAGEAASVARAMAVSLLPACALHVLLSLPRGRLGTRARRTGTALAYAVGAVVGSALWSARPELPAWPVLVEATALAVTAVPAAHRRYQHTAGLERQRMQWLGCAVAVLVGVAVMVTALRVLVGWPRGAVPVVCAVSVLVPAAFAAGVSNRLVLRADRLLVTTVSLAGLSGVVVATYLVIVIGLGRVPHDEERTLLLLSMAAAAVAATLYLPARERLSRFANSLVYGERQAPDELLRTFGSRLSRAIPLDELLLQLAESLRKTMNLVAVEVWTGNGGVLERAVSLPEQGPARLTLGAKEQPVVARAGVCGPAWLAVWLPSLLEGRDDAPLRMAPVTSSGELLGLIVVQRKAGGDPFTEEEERVLTELARQVALALHNVQLDSALQASLDEVRRHADELRASRARIVATSDEARRRIERDLHDGAQQHLVAMAVNLRLARDLTEDDPAEAGVMLDQLTAQLRETIQELRNLAHGIYPPLLVDAGLPEALRAAANRSPVTARVDADGVGRYAPEIEAAAYFCCLEALQNAGKHAGAGATVTIGMREQAGALLFDVADDGPGFDTTTRGLGQGFVNMADRLGAIGGRLRVESQPGAGTTISGTIPLGTI
ncbi:MAG: histidine kinase [Actinomycetota bacterium]|nr:histidine kinase [Actinomycetota bacterium]